MFAKKNQIFNKIKYINKYVLFLIGFIYSKSAIIEL